MRDKEIERELIELRRFQHPNFIPLSSNLNIRQGTSRTFQSYATPERHKIHRHVLKINYKEGRRMTIS